MLDIKVIIGLGIDSTSFHCINLTPYQIKKFNYFLPLDQIDNSIDHSQNYCRGKLG